jgi:hypothetical protein
MRDNHVRKEINMSNKKIDPGLKPKPIAGATGVPLFIFTGGGNDEVSTTATSFQGLKITPMQIVTVTQPLVVATIQMEVECRVTDGFQLKARMGRSNPGPYPSLNNEVVLTTSPNYETRYHMNGFRLPLGDIELYMEWCVTGGTGYIRYRYFTVILNA